MPVPEILPDDQVLRLNMTDEQRQALIASISESINADLRSRLFLEPPRYVGALPIREDVEIRLPDVDVSRFVGYQHFGVSVRNEAPIIHIDMDVTLPTSRGRYATALELKSDDPLEDL